MNLWIQTPVPPKNKERKRITNKILGPLRNLEVELWEEAHRWGESATGSTPVVKASVSLLKINFRILKIRQITQMEAKMSLYCIFECYLFFPRSLWFKDVTFIIQHPSVHSLIHSFFHLSLYPFIHSFTYSFSRPSIYSPFIHSRVSSFLDSSFSLETFSYPFSG
jgi:hypothetical protein